MPPSLQIYDCRMWTHRNDSTAHGVHYTASKDDDSVYAILLNWPADGSIGKIPKTLNFIKDLKKVILFVKVLSEIVPTGFTEIRLLGDPSGDPLVWEASEGYTEVFLPPLATVQHLIAPSRLSSGLTGF